MPKDRIGSGWRNSYEKDGPEGKSQHEYLSLSLDLGVLGDLSLACFPNDRRENGTQPSHLILFSENGSDSERLYIGGGWEKTARESGNKYLFCKLDLALVEREGPPGTDFLDVEPLRCRIVSIEKTSDRSPDVAIFRVDSDFQSDTEENPKTNENPEAEEKQDQKAETEQADSE